ncbi:hypothetical protein DL93DRAFT_831903 [Clavulina sp. PMI_390]|nr:hypothetical protein DL93DRAFT_831903 [Clavulina sp. PMI_390]
MVGSPASRNMPLDTDHTHLSNTASHDASDSEQSINFALQAMHKHRQNSRVSTSTQTSGTLPVSLRKRAVVDPASATHQPAKRPKRNLHGEPTYRSPSLDKQSAPAVPDGWAFQKESCHRIAGISPCASCAGQLKNDSCRFQDIRELHYVNGTIVESRLQSGLEGEVKAEFRRKFNIQPEKRHLHQLKHAIAENMLPVLTRELDHIDNPNVIYRSPEITLRVSCDICKTSILLGTWFCATCGQEICSDCYETRTVVSAEKRSKLNTATVSQELVKVIDAMSNLQCQPTPGAPTILPVMAFDLNPRHDQHTVIDPTGIPTRQIDVFEGPDIEDDIFQLVWSLGRPFVVTDILSKLEIDWTPNYFIQKFGSETYNIVNCTTNGTRRMLLRTFFSQFGNFSKRKDSYKLKDWPSASGFQAKCPELFSDFQQAVPIPNYARYDGIMNLAAHFPLNGVVPDLGPKGYSAFQASEDPKDLGTTRLHMDIADAVNIMTYASRRRDGSPGFAIWDIYHAEDSQAIRDFLRGEFSNIAAHEDPIHSQHYYLDAALREKLWNTKGVKAWRIEQLPGHAVFIPAGCAHQVSNSADCIKIAVDFVSPENIKRCSHLTKEFRSLNLVEAWKEDVLQLRLMLWYAWQSCNELAAEM